MLGKTLCGSFLHRVCRLWEAIPNNKRNFAPQRISAFKAELQRNF